MSKKGQGKMPKSVFSPQGKAPRFTQDPGSYDTQTPAWQFHRCDTDHADWGWGKLSDADRWGLLANHLASFERMTWAELRAAAGGKGEGKGTNHHAIAVEKFRKSAQDRLRELHLDDHDELFSLRLANKLRLYGVRDGRVLRFVWHDPFHGDQNGAYPIK